MRRQIPLLGSRKLELKLEADPGSLEALTAHPLLKSASRRASARQHSVYFDTADGALMGTGLSLCVRHVEGRRIQTIKCEAGAPAGLFDRSEYELEISGDTPELKQVDQPLGKLLASALDGGKVEPLFSIDVERMFWSIGDDGADIELVLDAGKIVANGSAEAICELELKHGPTTAMRDLARQLNDRASLRVGVQTMPERGYALLGGKATKAIKAEPLRLDPEMTVADGFRTIAHACIRHFRLNEARVLADRDPAALHQARVAMRRLRSALSLYKAVVDDIEFERVRKELRAICGRLGEARNLDVLLGRVQDETLREQLEAERAHAYDRVIAALEGKTFREFMLDLVVWVESGAWQAADATRALRNQSIADFASEALDRVRRRVRRRGARLETIDDEGRHSVRIETKKLRYSTEFFASLYRDKKQRRRHKAFLATLERLQASLGQLNDLATALNVMARLAPQPSSPEQSAQLAPPGVVQADPGEMLTTAVQAYDDHIDIKAFWR